MIDSQYILNIIILLKLKGKNKLSVGFKELDKL